MSTIRIRLLVALRHTVHHHLPIRNSNPISWQCNSLFKCVPLIGMMTGNLPDPIRNPKVIYNQLFINNGWDPAEDGSTFTVINPTTTAEICHVSKAKESDVNRAVAAARRAFAPGSTWRKMSHLQRGVLLNKLADLIERDRLYLASLETCNNGKVFSRVYSSDLQMVINVFRYFAGWTDKLDGKTLSLDGNLLGYTKHEPIGVCGAITPWNVPLIMLSWKTAPCLAAGNTLVLKPAEATPLTALYVASLVKEAGFPPGVFNVLPGYGAKAGAAMTKHMDIDKISFTGSTRVGRLIQKASADSNFKQLTLEMGGKNPLIIFPDVPLCDSVDLAHTAIFNHGGQICCAASLTYVHEDIYDEFLKRSIEKAERRKLGDPFDSDIQQGPQISETQQDLILKMLDDGLKNGGRLRCGGKKVEGLKGYFLQPTIITDLDDDHVLAKEEIFGPVQIILKFKTVEEVLRRCNASAYGLAAGVYTNDINNAINISNGLRAGSVWVNCYFAMRQSTPFGGYKSSGMGRDLGEESLRSYTEVKTVVIKTTSAT